ncbi:phage holin family protein [Dysgonomonas sp. Marseille-P4361]|uniref:phage holin family protein n=1 Tax=Dysgonomonas sp. Marseille-P4361 TaxID=2161820 RepID=UPI000D54F106|nr:phage holin family protein [Dysgonomonas sp. Marseille-P4361]
METAKKILEYIGSKLLQYITSIAGGLLVAIDSATPFFIPCLIATVLDIWSAYSLARRVHKKHPDRADGKFKSEYKYRVMYTMIIAFTAIILGNYVDVYIIKDSDMGVRVVVGFFLFYQLWSILENWSSENDNKLAHALQRVMVNKAERHLNVPLSDILLNEKPSINEEMEGNNEKDN